MHTLNLKEAYMENIYKYQYTECDQDITIYQDSIQKLMFRDWHFKIRYMPVTGKWDLYLHGTGMIFKFTYVLNIESQEIL